MKAFLRLSLALCAVFALALTGCLAKNDIRLLYDAPGSLTVPSATAPRVTVVQFDDNRGVTDLGQRKDGTAFQSSAGVPGWVTQAFADELARQGVQVSVALSMAQAQVNRPDYIVGGTVEKVWLSEKNLSSYQADIRVQVRVYSTVQLQSPVTRTFAAQQEKTGIPGAKLAEETLSGALSDALTNAAAAVTASLR